jgi:hypothetical protein
VLRTTPIIQPRSQRVDQVVPGSRPAPRYLERSYYAPAGPVSRSGVLRIRSLGIVAPVDAVGLDGTAMAVPNDSHRLGWLRSTAAIGDRIGRSVLAGHVSDEQDSPGALSRLGRIQLGALISWRGARGDRHDFRVVAVHRYSRIRGVPATTFGTDGPHLLQLITCAHRIRTGSGFHYTANLVVTARSIPGSR